MTEKFFQLVNEFGAKNVGLLTGDASVGRHLEIFWPGDGAFYGGTVAAYKTETGEHEVYYDDGGKETLQLSMQTVRWGPTPQPGEGTIEGAAERGVQVNVQWL